MLQLHVLSLACTVLHFVDVLGGRSHNSTKTTTIKPMAKLLNKFHQNDYRLTFERLEKLRDDKRYADVQCRTFKYNRTTPVVNASLIFQIDVGNEMEVIIQAYRFASNEYRLFPLRFQVNFCEAVAFDIVGGQKLIKMGNLVCPLVKGRKYYIYNFATDSEKYPPFLPNGIYMVQLLFMYRNIELFVLNGYATIDRPIPIPDS